MEAIKAYYNNIDFFSTQKLLLASIITVGILLLMAGLCISKYTGLRKMGYKYNSNSNLKPVKALEFFILRFPLRILANSINKSLNCLFLTENTQRRIVAVFALLLPVSGLLLYGLLNNFLTLWYARLLTLALCLLVPYYMFTLIIDYLKYNMNQKIPELIDSFRGSFVTHNRIKPALKDCSSRIDARLGAVTLAVADTCDLNKSLCEVRDRIDNTWFNIFAILLINYRENGGRLIGQLYKLSKCITRYNNVEKKKNRKLIWYEVFILAVSIFSLPAVIVLNRMILGSSIQFNFDTVGAFSRIAGYSVFALIVIRILRRM